MKLIKKKIFLLLVIIFLSLFTRHPVRAGDGSGVCTLSPIGVVVGTTANELMITFKAQEKMENGQIKVVLPITLSSPTNTEGQRGYTKVISNGQIGSPEFFLQEVTVPLINLEKDATVIMDFGEGGGSNGFSVSGGAISSEIKVYSQVSSGGSLRIIENSPILAVQSATAVDVIPPFSRFKNLSEGQVITSEDFLIEGTAVDYGGSRVAELKISFDNGLNWASVSSIGSYFSTWQYNWQSISEGIYDIQIEAKDFLGNREISHGFKVEVSLSVSEEETEEEVSEEETSEEEPAEEQPTEEKPISEMTTEELKGKIAEIQQMIIELLNQLIQLIQSQIVELSS